MTRNHPQDVDSTRVVGVDNTLNWVWLDDNENYKKLLLKSKTKILFLTPAHFWWHFMNTVSEMSEPCLGDAFEPGNKLHRQPRQYVKNDIRR